MNIRQKAIGLALLGLLVGGTSCKDFLDVTPANSVEDRRMFGNPENAEASVYGCYGALSSANYLGLRYPLFADLAADNLTQTGTFASFNEIDLASIQPSNTETTGMWGTIYAGINTCNNVIERVEATPGLSDALKKQYVAEAKALRGFHYFNLVRYWGGVPLVLKSTKVDEPISSLSIPRSTVEEVYNQVQADFDAAELDLPLTSDPSRLNKWSVRGLKARLALYRKQWATAADLCDQILANPSYGLVPNYRDLFEGGFTKESLWEVDFTQTNSSQFAFFMFPSPFGRGEVAATGATANLATASTNGTSYENRTTDKRYAATLSVGFQLNGTTVKGNTVVKYDDPGNGDDNYIVIRLGEIILTAAEAKAELGGARLNEALAHMNDIRVRAGLAPRTLATTNAQATLLSQIERERRLELALEGHRWFDLKRRDRVQAVLGTLVPNLAQNRDRELWPIPARELTNNSKLVQNNGY
ncbi:RagB/SusD family nutrient uptake outer membrane protein [Hymenobacter busanensis]|uniref:RagB/SusD family nutrient uptake outer membrane protein n=1 Tax=Hymenobacter busanensis TaxID=2607656 RepID=A0A7L5A0F5_9BACT|nr:RagB/SusD family nutrient uptake outer membrane protein [Hymenobacter busanensis]KAA9338312.1 RagB/SusD family nutrient uptake outer membrane protein [Hymenobacter busanensis]QHJ09264.1 RagB/SusD family nutrient uptake outer membrane protein [Hymenobacter busanensis]